MGHRILVAEDDAPIMLGLRDALRGLGHSVAGMVSTAAEAVRQAESEKPDIILMDISLAVYKHRIDLRLRESERRFATILRAIGDAVISTDTRGIIDFVNRAAEALTGRSFPEAVGKPLPGFLLLLDPELRQPLAVDR